MVMVRFLEFQLKLLRKNPIRKWKHSLSHEEVLFETEIEELKQVFDKFDGDKDGKISQQEYMASLKGLKQGSKSWEVEKIFEAADLDGDGFIDFHEFKEAQQTGVKKSEIRRAFQTLDVNGDGKISEHEVLQLMKGMNEKCSLEDCRKMVTAVDIDGDGAVDFHEFITMMTRSCKRHRFE